MKKVYLTISFILISILLFSGSLYGKSEKKETFSFKTYRIYRQAKKSQQSGNVYQAIDYYKQYIVKKPDHINANYNLAELYRMTRDYKNAQRHYHFVIKSKSKKHIMAHFYHGSMSMNLQEYNKAIESFENFRKKAKRNKKVRNYKKLALVHIEGSNNAINKLSDSVKIAVKHLNETINKAHIEFAPYPLNDSVLMFSALLEDDSVKTNNIRKIYTAKIKNDEWLFQGPIEGPINHYYYSSGNATLSNDGKRLFFTRCRTNWKKEEICEIFISTKNNGEWGIPVKLDYPVNNENYTSTQPTIGIDGQRRSEILYFVSNRPGGKGGLDIWYTSYSKKTGNYREPRNVGSTINSPGDESTPFYDNTTSTLFYSSTGYPGYGGFDIYKANGSRRKWLSHEHLPEPINSSYDDLYYTTLNVNEGFFTSNRPGSNTMENGSCCDDIYYFKKYDCSYIIAVGQVVGIPNKDIIDLLNRKFKMGIIYNDDKKPLNDIPAELYLVDRTTTEELFIRATRSNGNGIFQFNLEEGKIYKIRVKNYGYFDKVLTVKTDDFDCEDTLNIKATSISYVPDFTIRFNVYYQYDKFRLAQEAETKIDTSLIEIFDLFPNAVIEIGSHTDNMGSDSYNIRLSQKRSESVVNYLIERGITANRLIAKGYGESMPIAPNTNDDGSDNPDGRQLNRRTEIKIVGEINTFTEIDEY
ncbi:OmpA family protein [Bacteroidota bacterium]